MDALTLERFGATLIALLTVLTGAAQIAAPAPLLRLIGVEPTASAAQLFATVGMFMVLFGAALLHAQTRPQALPVLLLWIALQKIGASLMVAWGVSKGVFAPVALLVATFDFASGLLFFDLRRRGG
ncbi:hypothetical protein [Paraburkholderia elongata]|uniref:hypothetical protein n=1 Tax=Paraburkholderia elongata TaxID=2675747 RepID=UPI0015522E69|nr:hypothetical protein [Paraburkholderia elongata]